MNTQTTTSAALLRVRLPSDIVLPVSADLNALMRVLGQAKKVESVIKTSDNKWDGDYTYFTVDNALPEIAILKETLHADKETAQAARDENAKASLAKRAVAT